MEDFEKYLSQNYKDIKRIVSAVEIFLQWKKENKVKKISSQEVLRYLDGKKIKPMSKNSIINHLRKYFMFQIEKGERKDNPIEDLRIRITPKPVVRPLNAGQLDQIFENYRGKKLVLASQQITHYKFLTVLGFIIYQSITGKELKKLRKGDIDLVEGTINIPSTHRSNGRMLKLEARQILPLATFMEHWNNKALNKSIEKQIILHLKKMGYRKPNLQKLRESRIVLWLRNNNIRQVQYMAGFKYLSSIQKYRDQDIEGLRDKVREFHPLG
jgi:site-specific recombinase XerD